MCSGMLQDCPKTPKKRRKTERHDDQLPHYRKAPLSNPGKLPFRVFRVFRGSSKNHRPHRPHRKLPPPRTIPFRVFSVFRGSNKNHRPHGSHRKHPPPRFSLSVYSVVPNKTTEHTDHTESARRRASLFPCIQCIPWFKMVSRRKRYV